MSEGLLKKITPVIIVACVFGVFLVTTAQAQTPTPTPTPAAVVKVSSVDDVDLATYSGSGDLTGDDPICVYNSATSDFRISFATATGAFNFTGSAGNIPFSVRFRVGSGSWTSMPYNSPVGFTGASSNETCSGTPNATYDISMTQAALVAARPGSYSASLTIFLEQP
jgi:hypothetical protein